MALFVVKKYSIICNNQVLYIFHILANVKLFLSVAYYCEAAINDLPFIKH